MQMFSGVISKKDYLESLNSSVFSKLEKSNDSFLVNYRNELNEYNGKWTNDSFHTWSRQYEYPFFYSAIESYIKSNTGKKISILDAGSGLTFFPFVIQKDFENAEVVCTDYDDILIDGYARVNKRVKREVKFIQSDLRDDKFQEKSFDIIYCVSVLEHTNEYKKILKNFKKYLKDDGLLIVSFDLSLDGYRDISLDKAQVLYNEICKDFSVYGNNERMNDFNQASTFAWTTIDAIKLDPRLSPWRSPYKNALWSIKNFKLPKLYFNTAFYCQQFKKI